MIIYNIWIKIIINLKIIKTNNNKYKFKHFHKKIIFRI